MSPRAFRCVRSFVALAFAFALAACSGGGGSGPAALPAIAPTAPSQTPQSNAATLSGTVVDLPYDGSADAPGYSVLPTGAAAPKGAPIAGAAVYVGTQILTSATAPARVPAGFAYAVTDAHGAFKVTNAPAGHAAVTIFAPAPHDAILHQDVALASATPATATYYITVPTAGESAWLVQENADRAAFGAPPAQLDEAVLEGARYWSAFMKRNAYFAHCIPASMCVAGDTTPPPASYGPQDVDPSHRFYFEHGFSGASEGENIAAGFATWQLADAAFMAERSQCPDDSPTNCPFTETTGHFLNIIDAQYAWTGFGIVPPSATSSYYTEDFAEVWQATPHVSSAFRRNTFAGGLRS
jgi:uncharacterized protein YkwD/predicted small lipoprotein YifL